MKISEGTEFKIDIKTLVSVIVITSMFITLQSDIEEAKQLPPAVIDRIEYDLKQQWQTKHIEDLEEKVEEILFWCREIDSELHNKANKKK